VGGFEGGFVGGYVGGFVGGFEGGFVGDFEGDCVSIGVAPHIAMLSISPQSPEHA